MWSSHQLRLALAGPLLAACLWTLESPQPSPAEPLQSANPRSAIDVFPYFLQGDDRREEWTLGGLDVLPGRDPEGSRDRTVVATKFHSPDFYEVFRITRNEIQLRYEVFRPGGCGGEGNWIRRFEEIGGEGAAPGSVWLRRRMVPEQPVTTRCRIDRFVYDKQSRAYVHDPRGSLKELTIFISIHEARADWPLGDRSGFGIDRVLRLVSDWHPTGQVIETYDYARGKGMVNWRWLERIATLAPDTALRKPNIYRCMDGSGLVEVLAAPRDGDRPTVYKCDPTTGERTGRLDVLEMASAHRKEPGKAWYVVFRDLSREAPLIRKNERVATSYALPEWAARPNATIADLPYVYTNPLRPRVAGAKGGR